jgi:hypothetical protein
MSQLKVQFIRSLQDEARPLWPYDISQRIRLEFSWISLYKADTELNPDVYRGYMVRTVSQRAHSADDPAAFWCVIAANQSMGWQNITWTKEMLQALDSESALTSSRERLGEMLDMGSIHTENDHNTPPHVVADRNGFTLALACAVPEGHRRILREYKTQHGSLDPKMLAEIAHIPEEHIDTVLSPDFEEAFAKALAEIES